MGGATLIVQNHGFQNPLFDLNIFRYPIKKRLQTVPTEIQRSNHFKAYFEDQHLLVQFILTEFLQSYQSHMQIKSILNKCFDDSAITDYHFSNLEKIMSQLVGYLSPQKQHTSISRWKRGTLSKLKEYTEKLLEQIKREDKQLQNLYKAVHRAWLIAVHNLELLHQSQNVFLKTEQASVEIEKLKKGFKPLERELKRIKNQIPFLFRTYWNNENIIFCLFRYREALIGIYGNDFNKKFKWPTNHSKIKNLLDKRFQERGFDSLLPHINQICSGNSNTK